MNYLMFDMFNNHDDSDTIATSNFELSDSRLTMQDKHEQYGRVVTGRLPTEDGEITASPNDD